MNDTICAIATNPNMGAIAIIRVSGTEAIEIVNQMFKESDLTKAASHTIWYGHLVDQDEILDEVLVMLMRAPRTYTKEDVVEINCHGGVNTTARILSALLSHGIRLAEPGEFTKRAFLNGRISLLEAESVNDLIKAKNDAARIMALNNIGGKLTSQIRDIREKMGKVLANIEVNIDYPEYEDEIQVTRNLMQEYLSEFIEKLHQLVENSQNGKIINNGLNVAIIGRPNVGKSSILNFLLDEDKAIVTDIPGTTRDIVEGSINLNGLLLNFIDTAGLRQTEDTVEKIGVLKSQQMADQADLIIYVLNGSEQITTQELDHLASLKNKEIIVFVNKNDLPLQADLTLLKDYDYVEGNTKDNDGLEALKKAIITKYNLPKIINKEMSYLSNVRQIHLIEEAEKALLNAQESFNQGMEVDIIEIDLKTTWDLLGQLIGDAYNEELVDNIFRNFCLGK